MADLVRMNRAKLTLVAAVAIFVSFLVGRLSSQLDYDLNLYEDQGSIANQTRNDLRLCQIDLRASDEINYLVRQELGALRDCVHEYSLLFDLTKFDQTYSLDEVQRIRECL